MRGAQRLRTAISHTVNETCAQSRRYVRFEYFSFFHLPSTKNTQEMALKHQWLLSYNCYGGYKPKELENYKTVHCKFFL